MLTFITLAEFLGVDDLLQSVYKQLERLWRESYKKAEKEEFCELKTVESLDRVMRCLKCETVNVKFSRFVGISELIWEEQNEVAEVVTGLDSGLSSS